MIFNFLLQPGWLDYNPLYVFGKSLHQQEYELLTKGLDVSNRFPICLTVKKRWGIYHLTAIEEFSGVRNGKI